MKQSAYNPLEEALAQGASGEPHPDEDMIAAFLEGSLLDRERRQMLAHLTGCKNCREVVALTSDAAPEAEEAGVAAVRPKASPWAGWLAWASAAAIVALISLPGLLYWQQLQKQAPVAVNRVARPPATVGPAILEKPAAPIGNKPAPSRAASPTATATANRPLAPAPAVTAEPARETSVEMATRTKNPAPSQSQNQAQGGPQAVPVQPTVPVSAGARFEEQQPAVVAARKPSALSASSFASVQSARPMAKVQAFSMMRPHWRINSIGQVERSVGTSEWQAALPNEKSKMHVVSVFMGSVWIGGENTRVYRSTDNGATWTAVSLPAKNGALHVIDHIRFETAQNGTIEAEDGTTWTTNDGGQNWN